jgi:hypothetical protein
MDFFVGGPANGRVVRILSVIDAFTRECLVLEADTSGQQTSPSARFHEGHVLRSAYPADPFSHANFL